MAPDSRETFQARQYQDGDAAALNALYEAVTGRRRTYDQFAWQWLHAPAGPGEMWIIEAVTPDGEAKIIGHHGLMPLAFSLGAQTLIAGKTENTMVHPSYRRKILYPRYEKRFLADYADRFDLLFSTMGPPAPLRQRKALGYAADQSWQRFVWGLKRGATLAWLGEKLLGTASAKQRAAGHLASGASSILRMFGNRRFKGQLSLTALESGQARTHAFFEDFWARARDGYPLTPRRERDDLAWRFWDNPYCDYTTLITDDRGPAHGYAVLRRHSPAMFELEDIVCAPYQETEFTQLLHAVCSWCADAGASVLAFTTANDPSSPSVFLKNNGLTNMRHSWPISRLRPEADLPMLRKATDRGANAGGQTENWYVTPFIFEGRG